jgi:predicted ATP-grasp superfamily ATP-dependent carboligase
MKIIYDTLLKVGGIGISPWTRLGPERWFSNYKIASFFGPDEGTEGVPPIFSIYSDGITLPRYNSVNLLKEPAFQRLLDENFDGYKLFTYKSAEAPEHIEHFLLRPDEEYAHLSKTLENKAEFRRLFSSEDVRFPIFSILSKDNFKDLESVEELLNGRKTVVVQDAEMSGGKGTFFVNDESSFMKAKTVLSKSSAKEVVVSEVVSRPSERSIQCVATKHGIFMGSPQVQIIDSPLLINRNVVGAEKFCGVVIDTELTTVAQRKAMERVATTVGKKIVEMGYKGIFGIDFLTDDNGDVFVLEVNPRITGATPLLTAMYSGELFTPFYLLHILEIMKQDYQIEKGNASKVEVDIPSGSLMILHSQETVRVEVCKTLRTGIYSGDLEFIKPSVNFEELGEGEYLIQSIAPAGVKVSPAARLLAIYYKGSVLDKDDKISQKIQHDIESLYAKITVREVREE